MEEIEKLEKDINSMGYGIIPKMVFEDNRLEGSAKLLYAYFRSYTGTTNTCFPSRTKICNDLGFSKNTYSKHLKQLCDYGYVSVQQKKDNGKFAHNIYVINSKISQNTVSQNLTVSQKLVHDTVSQITVSQKLTPNNNNIYNNNNLFNNNKGNCPTMSQKLGITEKEYQELIDNYVWF